MTQPPSPTSLTTDAGDHTAPSTARPHKPIHAPRTALVLGGGLAGIAAALRLAEHGLKPTLIETRQRLGGRATSFHDPQTGQLLDNCQHVLMRCCTNLLDLYKRLGVDHLIDWHRRFYFIDRTGHVDVLQGDDLPAPLHLAMSMLRFASLTWREKLAIARGMHAILRTPDHDLPRLHRISFAQWLAQHHQPQRAIDRYWAIVIVSALNERIDRCAADYALQVFRDGFLSTDEGYEMGLPRVPLARLYDVAAQRITSHGGSVMLSTSVRRFVYDGYRIAGVEIDGGHVLTADAYLSALPHDRLLKLCEDDMLDSDPRLRPAARIEVSPILGIHLWFDQPLMDQPHLAFMDSPLHWIFARRPSPDDPPGQHHYHGVISAAHDLIDQPGDAILDRILAELRTHLPWSRARLLRGRVIKEKRATFAIEPGIDDHRPHTIGGLTNLFLAGDWCQTGWPATMEGATRSGYLAAHAILQHLQPHRPQHPLPQTLLAPDLPTSALFRALRP